MFEGRKSQIRRQPNRERERGRRSWLAGLAFSLVGKSLLESNLLSPPTLSSARAKSRVGACMTVLCSPEVPVLWPGPRLRGPHRTAVNPRAKNREFQRGELSNPHLGLINAPPPLICFSSQNYIFHNSFTIKKTRHILKYVQDFIGLAIFLAVVAVVVSMKFRLKIAGRDPHADIPCSAPSCKLPRGP